MPGWLVDDPRKITVNYIYISNVKIGPFKSKEVSLKEQKQNL
jgi:hypothetical protein